MKTMGDMTTKINAKGRVDANTSWLELLAADCNISVGSQ